MLERTTRPRPAILTVALLACASLLSACESGAAPAPEVGGEDVTVADTNDADTTDVTNGDVPDGPEDGQSVYASPEAALAALTAICKSHDGGEIEAAFGASWAHLLVTHDTARDKVARQEFMAACEVRSEWLDLEDGSKELVVGVESWPMPIPLRQSDAGWWFDSASGAEEILNRRIGEHELGTIETMRAYVQAQADYASVDRDGDEVLEYAQRLSSSEGAKDGLYWPEVGDGDVSPFGPLVAKAGEAYMAERKSDDPFMGYYFRILTEQGSNAPGGAHEYVINGNMIAGFALVAYPSDYGNTGVMSFVVSHQGVVHEKDLGDDTASQAKAMTAYDPDDSWALVDAED